MFSKISQLGKTFADEINRINDEVNNTPAGQNQIADPSVAKRIIATKTPEVDELDKPEDLQKEDSVASEDTVINSTNNDGTAKNVTNESKVAESADERVVPGTTIKYSSLPPEVCSKLNKFEKYEKKYPQLFEAYKIEKKKTALIKAFENMLKEKTPCSSIAELNAVRDYLNSLESKSDMLNQELTKLTKEKKDRDEQVKKFQSKISDLQKALTTKNAEDEKLKKEQERQILELKEAQKSTDNAISENKS